MLTELLDVERVSLGQFEGPLDSVLFVCRAFSFGGQDERRACIGLVERSDMWKPEEPLGIGASLPESASVISTYPRSMDKWR